MGHTYIKKERQLLKVIEKLVQKWRKYLQIDPLWDINIVISDDDEMEGAIARVDSSNAEYFSATLEVTNGLLYLLEDKFISTINEVVCHELVHLVMIDFFRTAQLIAGGNETLVKELRYKYEQFTSRFHKAFVELDKQLNKKEPIILSVDKKEKEEGDNT